MATKPPHRVMEPLQAPQHYVPPTNRELRAQVVQRLQAGLFGLAAIILIVGLANIINDRAKLSDSGSKPAPQVQAGATEAVSDPLADIGVVPSSTPVAKAQAAPTAGAINPAQ